MKRVKNFNYGLGSQNMYHYQCSSSVSGLQIFSVWQQRIHPYSVYVDKTVWSNSTMDGTSCLWT